MNKIDNMYHMVFCYIKCSYIVVCALFCCGYIVSLLIHLLHTDQAISFMITSLLYWCNHGLSQCQNKLWGSVTSDILAVGVDDKCPYSLEIDASLAGGAHGR